MISCAALIAMASLMLPITQTKTTTCESVEDSTWTGRLNGTRKTCWMYKTTAIDSTGYIFSSMQNSAVEALTFQDNKKIEFLPENIAATFSNLIILYAKNCSVKSISRINFKDLNKLLVLILKQNQITTLFRGTFEDLVSMKDLELNDNKIKLLNGAIFAELKNIENIWLHGNECINEDFFGTQKISEMNSTVTAKCGFCEATNPIDYTICEMSKQLQTLETDCDTEKKEINLELEEKSEENSNHVTQIATLKVELVAAISAKAQAESHSSSVAQACEKMKLNEITTLTAKITKLETELKATKDEVIKAKDEIINSKDEVIRADSKSERSLISLKEVFDKVEAKLEQSFNTRMEMKLDEISDLKDELQRKDQQINDLNSKNAQLEKKIQALGGTW